MKIRGFTEEFRSLPMIAEGSRKRTEEVSIIYHIYLSQSPGSRVQSPESSPVLDYARSESLWKIKKYETKKTKD